MTRMTEARRSEIESYFLDPDYPIGRELLAEIDASWVELAEAREALRDIRIRVELAEVREALRDIRIRTGEKKVWRIAKMEKNDG